MLVLYLPAVQFVHCDAAELLGALTRACLGGGHCPCLQDLGDRAFRSPCARAQASSPVEKQSKVERKKLLGPVGQAVADAEEIIGTASSWFQAYTQEPKVEPLDKRAAEDENADGADCICRCSAVIGGMVRSRVAKRRGRLAKREVSSRSSWDGGFAPLNGTEMTQSGGRFGQNRPRVASRRGRPKRVVVAAGTCGVESR